MQSLVDEAVLTPDALPPWLTRERRTIVVVDLVESVRLMQRDEVGVITRWLAFVAHVRDTLLATSQGRLVKSLGDGLLLEFERVDAAVRVALALQPALDAYTMRAKAESLYLRTGVHLADVVVTEIDVLGSGVNLAARLAALAGPGEVVVSADVRDALTDGLDARVTDLGDCFLKHVDGSVRAYRLAALSAPGAAPPAPPADLEPLAVTVAVVPFAAIEGGWAFGDALADAINARLSRNPGLRVISRLSTVAVRHADDVVDACRAQLRAAFVLSGHYRLHEGRAWVSAQLCDARDGAVQWADRSQVDVAAVFGGDDAAVDAMVREVARVIAGIELRRAQALALPTLESFSLYVGGVALLNRLRLADFERVRQLFEALNDRQPRHAAPLAMLAKWHLMRLLQGWAADPRQEVQAARARTRRALDLQPDHALALAVEALLASHADGDLDAAHALGEQAVAADPQETMGWMALAGVASYRADGDAALAYAWRAVALSPADPRRFMFDLMLAAGELAKGRAAAAVQHVQASLRLNATHASAHRLHVIALALAGRGAEARVAAEALLRVDPSYRVGTFEARYPGRGHPHAREFVQALRDAGIPS